MGQQNNTFLSNANFEVALEATSLVVRLTGIAVIVAYVVISGDASAACSTILSLALA